MNLALRINNNNYYPILKEYLDIAKNEDNFTTLDGIDRFLARFTTEEILDSIVRSNILDQDTVYNSTLVIIYRDNEKIRELETHTLSDTTYIDFEELAFILNMLDNKNVMNQINNYFISKNYMPEDLKNFANILKNDSIVQTIHAYDQMSYGSKRLVKDYVYNEIYFKKLEMIRKKEKLS